MEIFYPYFFLSCVKCFVTRSKSIWMLAIQKYCA